MHEATLRQAFPSERLTSSTMTLITDKAAQEACLLGEVIINQTLLRLRCPPSLHYIIMLHALPVNTLST